MLSPSAISSPAVQSPVIIGQSLNPTRNVSNTSSLWTKVKSKVSDTQGSNTNLNNIVDVPPDNEMVTKLLKNGELITYVPKKSLQIWDWSALNKNNTRSSPDGNLHMLANFQIGDDVLLIEPLFCNRKSGQHKYLIAFSCPANLGTSNIKWEVFTLNLFTSLSDEPITGRTSNQNYTHKVIDMPVRIENLKGCNSSEQQTEIRTAFAEMKYLVKYSSNYFTVGDALGNLNIYSIETLEKIDLDLQCKVHDYKPIFDLQGSFLVYNSAESDSFRQKIKSVNKRKYSNESKASKDSAVNDHYKKVLSYENSTGSNISSDNVSLISKSTTDYRISGDLLEYTGLTPLSLSRPNTLAKKVWKNLSKSAIDGAFLIGEASHSKVKSLFYSDQDADNDASLKQKEKLLTSKNFKEVITKVLNTLSWNSNYVIIMDLKHKSPLASFSPPDGCSNVSLSPYDFLVSTTTSRGDDIFIWDYSKFETEIRLLETFRRGRRSAIVQDIVWSKANKSIILLSKLSGSIHCFVNESDELDGNKSENKGRRHSSKHYDTSKLDDEGTSMSGNSWVVSSLGAKSIALCSHTLLPKMKEQFIIAMDKIYLYAITLDGYIVSKIPLPSCLVPISRKVNENTIKITSFANQSSTLPKASVEQSLGTTTRPLYNHSINPLSQVIIEPCAPFVPWYNDRRIEIATYKESEEGNGNVLGYFHDRIDNFDPLLPSNKIQFGRETGKALFYADDVTDLRSAMDTVTFT